jgi:hypothetical protein
MVAFNVVGRFRHQNELRSYRRELAAEVAQDFALRLLPSLIDLPLPILDADGQSRDLDELLRQMSRVALAGAPGSGRRLAFLQLAHRWASEQAAPAPIPVLISLAYLDDERSSPGALLAPWTRSTDGTPAPQPRRGGFPFFRGAVTSHAPVEPSARWLLLLQDWERLPAERRLEWHSTLLEAPVRWPELRMVVALPRDEAV